MDVIVSTPRVLSTASSITVADSPLSNSTEDPHDDSLLTAITENEAADLEHKVSHSSISISIQSNSPKGRFVQPIPYYTLHIDPVRVFLPITCAIGPRYNNPIIYRDRQCYYQHSATQKFVNEESGPGPQLIEVFSKFNTRDIFERFDRACILKINREFRPFWVKRQIRRTKKMSHPIRLAPQGLFVVRERGESMSLDLIGPDADWKYILGSYIDHGCQDVFFACFDYASI